MLKKFNSQSVGDVPRDAGGGIEQGHGGERVKEGGSLSPVSPFIYAADWARFYEINKETRGRDG